jgi:hypothetical protein
MGNYRKIYNKNYNNAHTNLKLRQKKKWKIHVANQTKPNQKKESINSSVLK